MTDITATLAQSLITATVTNPADVTATLAETDVTATVSETNVNATLDSAPVTATLVSGGTVNASLSSAPITATISVTGEETDPIVGAVTGLVKADGAGNISAAIADTDYQSALGYTPLDPSNNLSDVSTRQTALNNVTNVSAAANEYVLTKDTGTGDAIWKAAGGVGGAESDPIVGAVNGIVQADGIGNISAVTIIDGGNSA